MIENSTPAGDAKNASNFKGSVGRCHKKCHRRPQPEIDSPEWLALLSRIADRTVDAPNGCRIWTGAGGGKSQHGRLKWRGELLAPHRLVLEDAIGRRLRPGEDACHHCDNPPCVRPDHLFAGTRSDNMRDASLKGRLGRPKFGYETVKAVVRESRSGRPHEQLVKEYGVSHGTVDKLVHGKTRFGALAIAELEGTPYRHPRASLKKLAKAIPLLRRRESA